MRIIELIREEISEEDSVYLKLAYGICVDDSGNLWDVPYDIYDIISEISLKSNRDFSDVAYDYLLGEKHE